MDRRLMVDSVRQTILASASVLQPPPPRRRHVAQGSNAKGEMEDEMESPATDLTTLPDEVLHSILAVLPQLRDVLCALGPVLGFALQEDDRDGGDDGAAL